ncbi:MAG: ABC transporter permease [Clostridia bacterium]|nr:ABC transporter permease [Clostridia bacterium]
MNMVIGVLEQGFIYALLAMGVLITYRILDFPDLTVDSSFPLGAAISAVLTLNGTPPALTLPIALLAGGAAGLITGLIHVKCGVRDLLSGIITMTALYSVNLRVAGRANLPIYAGDTLFLNEWTRGFPPWLAPYSKLIIILFIVALVKIILDLFLKTKAGYLLRAVGDNPSVVAALNKDGGYVKIQGLMIANAFCALAGAVMCQHQRFFDISMGTGTLVTGLASVIIGLNMFSKLPRLKNTLAVIAGSILYKACVSAALSLGLAPTDLRLITAALFLVILILGKTRVRKVKPHA